jgi:hypothetical protein
MFAVCCVAGCNDGSNGGTTGAKRLFVTSARYTGDLTTQGGAASGLQAGDNLCVAAANAVSLGGTWKAWLSDATTDAITRIDDVGPWFQLDGSKTFESKAALRDAALVSVSIDEQGQSQGNSGHWTGSVHSGARASDHCTSWASASSGVDGETGGVDSLDMWSSGYTDSCDTKNRIVCFEQ